MMKNPQQTFILGSQWIYIKLYAGSKTVENLLLQVIPVIIRDLHKKKSIEKWFFIRYSDPYFHLRIRLLITESKYIGEIINIFYKKLNQWNKNDLLWKIQYDTYGRELERYGGSLIHEAESVFCADSECILNIIKEISSNENCRWLIALKLIDSMLSDFNLLLQEKKKLMETWSLALKAEFGFNEYNSKQFNIKFREHKLMIESVLNGTMNDEFLQKSCIHIKKRSTRLVPIIDNINRKLITNKLNINLYTLLESYIHMMLNRLFKSKNRIYEMILYDFMRRYYASELAENFTTMKTK
jgi:thiopeptide-type bacteriocin biosynthesis protein